MKIDIGISEKERKIVAEGLSHLLADTYTLYLKTHNFHWNVTGALFETLHLMFETHYNELALAVDEIAERIRSLGFPAPASYAEFTKLSTVKDSVGVFKAEDMLREIVLGNEAVIHTARTLFSPTEKAKDHATIDLLTRRLEVHEKQVWMFRSLLES